MSTRNYRISLKKKQTTKKRKALVDEVSYSPLGTRNQKNQKAINEAKIEALNAPEKETKKQAVDKKKKI